MSSRSNRLYALLPAYHRERDLREGAPLQSLLSVIGEQVDRVEEDIRRLYDDWFIETCARERIADIGALVGYEPVGDGSLHPRIEVAGTVALRRRKGTRAALQALASAVSGWPAWVAESQARLARTQHLHAIRPSRGRTVDLRDARALASIDGAFDVVAHGIDVRRVASRRTQGQHNIPSVGVSVWRLKPYSVTQAPAYCLEEEGPECFTFSVLGNDGPLCVRPDGDGNADRIEHLPLPLRRRMSLDDAGYRQRAGKIAERWYGEGRSLVVYVHDWPERGAPQPVPRERVLIADLSDWRVHVPRGSIAVDPERGRLMFPHAQPPKRGVRVTYHALFPADVGAGEYARRISEPASRMRYLVRKALPWREDDGPAAFTSINDAIRRWRKDQRALGHAPTPADSPEAIAWRARKERLRAAVIEIVDSSAYTESLRIVLREGEYLQLRARPGCRPTVRLLDRQADGSDAFTVRGAHASRFKLDGLLIAGRGLRIFGNPDGRFDDEDRDEGEGGSEERRSSRPPMRDDGLCDVVIRHCTLVPGWSLDCDCKPQRPNEPSIALVESSARLVVERSIVGAIHVRSGEVRAQPAIIDLRDSIVDATGTNRLAIGASRARHALAEVSLRRCSVFGKVEVHAMPLAENSLFTGPVRVLRRQTGCLRHCHVPVGSRTPRRHHCEPDRVVQAVTPDEAAAVGEAARVRPRFTSRRFGHPAYAQLALDCADEIVRGADDGSEMGVYHHLRQPQRLDALRARIDEHMPASMQGGVLIAN